jgi:hypothetical protein
MNVADAAASLRRCYQHTCLHTRASRLPCISPWAWLFVPPVQVRDLLSKDPKNKLEVKEHKAGWGVVLTVTRIRSETQNRWPTARPGREGAVRVGREGTQRWMLQTFGCTHAWRLHRQASVLVPSNSDCRSRRGILGLLHLLYNLYHAHTLQDSGVYVKGLNAFVVKGVPELRNVLEVGVHPGVLYAVKLPTCIPPARWADVMQEMSTAIAIVLHSTWHSTSSPHVCAMQVGNKNRSVGATLMNQVWRFHCLIAQTTPAQCVCDVQCSIIQHHESVHMHVCYPLRPLPCSGLLTLPLHLHHHH